MNTKKEKAFKEKEFKFFFENEENITENSFLPYTKSDSKPDQDPDPTKVLEIFDYKIKKVKKPKLVVILDTSKNYTQGKSFAWRVFISYMKKFVNLLGFEGYAACFETIIVDSSKEYGKRIIKEYNIQGGQDDWWHVFFGKDGKMIYPNIDSGGKINRDQFYTEESAIKNSLLYAENKEKLKSMFNEKIKNKEKKVTMVNFQDFDFDDPAKVRQFQLDISNMKVFAHIFGKNYNDCFNFVSINKSKESGKSIAHEYGIGDRLEEFTCFFDKDGNFSFPISV